MSSAYVGNRVQNVDIGEELDKVTRVVLVVDSDHVYTAGNGTGRTVEREIPWGSQAMADSLLRKLSGAVYKPFNAERALISPAFEIGDPVTVGGVYSRIIGADINYGISGLVDIYAPDLDVTEDEYPAEKTQQSSIERQLAATRSLISKTSEDIRLEVSGLDDKYTALSVTLDGVTISDSTGKTLIKGSSIDTSTIKANSITADKLNLTGAISFGDLDAQTQIKITNAYNMALNNQLPSYIKSTYIDRVSIQSPTIVAGTFIGNEFNVISETSGGSFNLYGKYGNASIKALEIAYSSGDAPVVYFGGTIARFDFGAVYYDCGISLGQYDLSFNYGGGITSVRDLAARVAALEAR